MIAALEKVESAWIQHGRSALKRGRQLGTSGSVQVEMALRTEGDGSDEAEVEGSALRAVARAAWSAAGEGSEAADGVRV